MKKTILHSIFLLSCFVLNAQYWTNQHFNVENGLPDNYTFAIEKFKGEIYVATDGGLVTFDGVNFKLHNRKKIRYPVSLLNQNDSILYIGSWLDGIITKDDHEIKNLYPARINRILKNEGKSLIYNTYRRYTLLVLDQNKAIDTLIYMNEEVNTERRIAIDKSRIYVSEGKEIKTYNWNGKPTQDFPYKPEEKIEVIYSIDDFLFFGDKQGTLSWVSKKNPEVINTHQFKKPSSVKRIVPYKKRQMLVQLEHRAEYNSLYMLTFDETYSKITNIESMLNIKYGISDIFIDCSTIYIASYGNGIYKIFPSLLKSYQNKDHQIPTTKFSYENNAGNMVFATENISYVLKENDSFIQKKNPFRLNTIFEFQEDYYLSSHENLFNSKLEKIIKNRVNNFVHAEKNDTLYYSKYFLIRYHQGIRKDVYCIEYNEKDKKINTGVKHHNNVFIGTQNGIKKFIKNDVDVWEKTFDSLLHQNFKQRVIREILPHKEDLIITTPYEAYMYDEREVTPVLFTKENVYINDTFIDAADNIYFGTNKGFWVITNNFQYHFNTKNGTNSNNIYSFYQDSKGIIWITSGNGIMEFNPQLLDVTIPPQIEVDKKNIKDDHVSIAFKSITREFSEAVIFEYKINNSQWRRIQRKKLDMSNLRPGDYSLSFRGKHFNSEWSIPKTVRFSIEPKWYQITVIKVLIFIAITIILLGFLAYRLRVIKRRNETLSSEINRRIFLEHKVENLREEVARDFHDEIGNKIASVIGLSNNIKHSEKVNSPKIDKIASLSKEIYHTAKDFVWSLNPKNNNIDSLCKYLRDYGENFFDLFEEIDFLYQEIDIIPIDISYIKSRNIILAFKEILANILKHSQATKVVFKVQLENTKFEIQIQDNGIGFNNNISTHGNGLKNIKKRMEMINAEMHIEKSEGVFYTFILDLQEELTNINE
ncbi:ATP-binding protein [uncultured Kordia sp.]|uniref:sensor histidine kinase n=1 Tax=uncultured Kordia sp. TaxID=507699 RepID=UPI00261AEF04|nr:ATP-binding protein [uncultured Kordia sp.]